MSTNPPSVKNKIKHILDEGFCRETQLYVRHKRCIAFCECCSRCRSSQLSASSSWTIAQWLQHKRWHHTDRKIVISILYDVYSLSSCQNNINISKITILMICASKLKADENFLFIGYVYLIFSFTLILLLLSCRLISLALSVLQDTLTKIIITVCF